MKNGSPLKQYIDKTITKEAEIKYDRETKQWYGILDHLAGLIYSIRKTRADVKKELGEVLEEFIALYFKGLGKRNGRARFIRKLSETTPPKTQRAYR